MGFFGEGIGIYWIRNLIRHLAFARYLGKQMTGEPFQRLRKPLS